MTTAPLDRARDALILARQGSPAMRREWGLFAAESPGLARLVTKWADADEAERAQATREADRALERAELVLAKSGGATVAKAAGGGTVSMELPSSVEVGISAGDLARLAAPTVAKKKKRKKAKILTCPRCGTEADPGERFCTTCGSRSRHYSPLADKKLPMNEKSLSVKGKKARKALRGMSLKSVQAYGLLTKAAGAPAVSRGQGIRQVLEIWASDGASDESTRAARDALARLRA